MALETCRVQGDIISASCLVSSEEANNVGSSMEHTPHASDLSHTTVDVMDMDLIQLDGQLYHVKSLGKSSPGSPPSELPPQQMDHHDDQWLEVEVVVGESSTKSKKVPKEISMPSSGSSQLQTMLLNDLPKQPQSLSLLDNVHKKEFKPGRKRECECYLSQDKPQGPVVFQVVKQNGSVCNMALNPVDNDIPTMQVLDSAMERLEKDLSLVEKRVTCDGVVYVCSFCKATFSRLANLKRHRLVHTINVREDGRYSCEHCSKKFHQQCDMKRHLATHSGTEPFRCSLCKKGFIRNSDLQVHLRFHTRDRSFQCEFCEKAFYQSGDLNRHIRRVHLKSQLFACGHCNKKFQRDATLSRHIQMAHSLLISKSAEHAHYDE